VNDPQQRQQALQDLQGQLTATLLNQQILTLLQCWLLYWN